MIYNATPNERTGKLSPNQMYGIEEPLYFTGMGAKLKFGAAVVFETPIAAPLGSMQSRGEYGVLLGPDENHGKHGYRILCRYKGEKGHVSRIAVAANMKVLPFVAYTIPDLRFNRHYSPGPDATLQEIL